LHYAVFSDIHGNIRALQAVWRTLENDGLADRPLLNAGDNVGYGDAPEECVQFLRDHPNVLNVRGNYDKNVASFLEREAEYRKKWARSRPEKYEALRRDSEAISEETRRWLHDLPVEVSVTLETVPVLVVHYAPGFKEGLGRWTSDARLRELAAETTAKVVVCGHTHTPFVRDVGGVLWVNPGSLGRSWDGRARYAVLDLEPGRSPWAELKSAL
jgi:putative phosphoesterase